MKKILLFIIACFVGFNLAEAAVRDSNTITRQQETTPTTVTARAGVLQQQNSTTTVSNRSSASTVSRTSSVNRSANQQKQSVSARTATTTIPRSNATTVSRTSRTSNTKSNNTALARTASIPRITQTTNAIARAATTTTSLESSTFGTGYNACRDAYFTCMDQFCATANDSYRRCICSSKITEIQNRERALNQASGQLQDFANLNLSIIDKTANEVKAMLSASEGETAASKSKDSSSSAQQLAGISEILANAKSESLSTQGILDIAGDINAIWATTDLASGANIANLTGEQLYNAVYAQCVELVATSCPSDATLKMVVSAYGMYIENDCSLIINNLDKQLYNANASIRDAEKNLNLARLDNYNAHNSTSINDCIANVRKDLTADTACGEGYVHCLDITGRYLNRDTGAPIYSPEFYQLETQVSLSGDVLTNQANRLLVAELNNKKIFAEKSLDTCRDLSDEVWNEFMRQAITEIYQGQQEKIRQVKEECLDVVNQCYDEQSQSLKDFSNVEEQLLLGSRLELSEELCQEKLYACSNLYGDPNGDGLDLLVSAMKDITDQKIAKECRATLESFAKDLCAVPSTDSIHSYPYACRVYAPGEQKYATNLNCNNILWEKTNTDENVEPSKPIIPSYGYVCFSDRIYSSCKQGYFLAILNEGTGNYEYNPTPKIGNACVTCLAGATCSGGTAGPVFPNDTEDSEYDCGDDYIGSLYQKMVRYAMQACVRPSESDSVIPTNILADVNSVMDSIKIEMANVLSSECERLGGTWVDTQWLDKENGYADGIHDKTGHKQFKKFYDETSANTKWGYCADSETVTSYAN